MSEDPGSGPAPPPGTPSSSPPARGEVVNRPFLYVCLAVGWAGIVVGLHGLVANAKQANPLASFKILIGLNIFNDAVAVPVLIGLSLVARRLVPRWVLPGLQVGFIASGVLILYAYPQLGDWGRTARAGYSRLPWDYGQNLAVVLGAVWFVSALIVLRSWRHRRPVAAKSESGVAPTGGGADADAH